MQLRTQDRFGQQSIINIDKDPDRCPICHHGIAPKDLQRDVIVIHPLRMVERVFQCPRDKCGHIFIGRYSMSGPNSFGLAETVPQELVDHVGFGAEVMAYLPISTVSTTSPRKLRSVDGS